MKLGIFAQRYRIVKISREVPQYLADHLGPNLLTEGGFESWPSGFTVSSPIKGQAEPFANADTKVFRSGTSSLRLRKTLTSMAVGIANATPIALPAAGRYLLSGYVRIDENLKPAMEGDTPRPDYGQVSVNISGSGITTDPPREFSMWGGQYPIDEKTPGWQRFLIPFDASAETKVAGIEIVQFGVGTAWLDDIQIQKVNNDAKQ
jgi:hypothetical protein